MSVVAITMPIPCGGFMPVFVLGECPSFPRVLDFHKPGLGQRRELRQAPIQLLRDGGDPWLPRPLVPVRDSINTSAGSQLGIPGSFSPSTYFPHLTRADRCCCCCCSNGFNKNLFDKLTHMWSTQEGRTSELTSQAEG